MATAIRVSIPGVGVRLYVKGASEVLIQKCASVVTSQTVRPTHCVRLLSMAFYSLYDSHSLSSIHV